MLHVHRWKLTYPLKYYGWKMYFLLKLSLCRGFRGHVNLPSGVHFLHPIPSLPTHPSHPKIEGARCIHHPQRPVTWGEDPHPPMCDLQQGLQAGPNGGKKMMDFHGPTPTFFGPTKKTSAKNPKLSKIHTLMIYIIPLILIMYQQKNATWFDM